jgi:hypothetical protein
VFDGDEKGSFVNMKDETDLRINYKANAGATSDDEVEVWTRGGIWTAGMDCMFKRRDLMWNFMEMWGGPWFCVFQSGALFERRVSGYG